MVSLPKVMITFAIVLSTILFWATSNVCRYNFAIEKKTNQLNILAQEIDASIPTENDKAKININNNTILEKKICSLLFMPLIKKRFKISLVNIALVDK